MTSMEIANGASLSVRFYANLRRFIRWLTTPQVFLSLIMLVVMFYMVIIPLYRMVITTITFSENDLRYAPDAVVGQLTILSLAENVDQ